MRGSLHDLTTIIAKSGVLFAVSVVVLLSSFIVIFFFSVVRRRRLYPQSFEMYVDFFFFFHSHRSGLVSISLS